MVEGYFWQGPGTGPDVDEGMQDGTDWVWKAGHVEREERSANSLITFPMKYDFMLKISIKALRRMYCVIDAECLKQLRQKGTSSML